MVSADGQPSGYEAIRKQKGSSERKNKTKNRWTLGDSSV